MEFTFVNLIEEPGTLRTLLCYDLHWCNSPDSSRITCDFLYIIPKQRGVQRHWGWTWTGNKIQCLFKIIHTNGIRSLKSLSITKENDNMVTFLELYSILQEMDFVWQV